MSYILRNVDSLAPHTGTLLKHLDPLLLYAGSTEEDVEVAEELLEPALLAQPVSTKASTLFSIKLSIP